MDNKKRKDVFLSAIPEIEKKIGYVFKDKSLLTQAFTRTSFCNEHRPSEKEKYQSNEVLEFFGDSVLSAVIVSFLLSSSAERCENGIRTELGEGDYSNIKSKLSDKTNLSRSTKKLGLEKYLLMGEGDLKLGISEEPSVMEDLFESIVGAIYIDSDKDIKMLIKVVTSMLDMSVYADSSAPSVSPKNALQEWCADKRRRLPSPVYKTISESGPDHKKTYVRGVYIGERLIAEGEGKNQKAADTAAARVALMTLTAKEAQTNAPEAEQKPGATIKAKPKAESKPEPRIKAEPIQPKPKPEPKIKTEPIRPKPEPKVKTEPIQPKPEPKKKARRTDSPGQGTRAESATMRLKRLAAGSSVASPAFRDLGSFVGKNGVTEYHIECAFMGKRIIASGETRQDARERAAALLLSELKI